MQSRFFLKAGAGNSITDAYTERLKNYVEWLSWPSDSFGGIAQLVERVVRNDEAWGSNPHTSTTFSFAKWQGD